MTDDVNATSTTDDARRAALLARIQANNEPTSPSNPWALALGWIGGLLLATGVIVLIVGGGQAANQYGPDSGLTTLIVGGIIAAFGLLSLLLLFTAKAVTWQPRRGAE